MMVSRGHDDDEQTKEQGGCQGGASLTSGDDDVLVQIVQVLAHDVLDGEVEPGDEAVAVHPEQPIVVALERLPFLPVNQDIINKISLN
jgi:hypothetical protein